MYPREFRDAYVRPRGLEVTPIRDMDAEIPHNLRDPHYTNPSFTNPNVARTIYLTQGLVVRQDFSTEMVEGLDYNYSDRINSWYDYELIQAAHERGLEATSGRFSATYYEVFLRTVYDDESVNLHHILAGVNRSNGYSYRVYGTGEPAPTARVEVHELSAPSWPRHSGNEPSSARLVKKGRYH